MLVCVDPRDMIVKGSAAVPVGNLPSARVTDMKARAGMIVMGQATVSIGG
jgi:uncharacterized Zn-binding protein involved in type VI secretion